VDRPGKTATYADDGHRLPLGRNGIVYGLVTAMDIHSAAPADHLPRPAKAACTFEFHFLRLASSHNQLCTGQ
jgi:hypothetical protein